MNLDSRKKQSRDNDTGHVSDRVKNSKLENHIIMLWIIVVEMRKLLMI